MVNSFSFTTSGATPVANPLSQGTVNIAGNTPASKALATAAAPQTTFGNSQQQKASAPISTGAVRPATQIGTFAPTPPVQQPGMLSAPTVTPTSHTVTVNNVDGSSHTTKQTFPETAPVSKAGSQTNASSSTPPEVNPNQGLMTPTGGSAGTPLPTQAPNSFSGLLGTVGGYGTGTNSNGVQLATKNLEDVQNSVAQENARIEGLPIGAGDQTGREAVAARLASSKVANAQSALSNALTSQGQQIGAAESAAGLAKGSPTSYGQTVFDPVTNTFKSSSGSNLDPQTQASTLAQNVLSGKMTYAQAKESLGYAGSVGVNFLNNAITSAGGDPLKLEASGSATQNVIGTQTQQVEGYKSALQQGQNLQAQLKDLITTFGLNPNDLNAANVGIQKIAQNTSDPHYQQLSNYINDIANTYAQVLTPPGGSATDTTRSIASSMLNATASGQSIIATMQALDNAAQAKIAGVSTTGGSSGSGGGTIVQTSAGPINTDW